MAASVHRLQLVHSATSMIMFHFFIGDCSEAAPLDKLTRYFAGSRCASLSVRLISLSLSAAAKAADIYSVRPSQSSIWTSALAPASEWVVLVCVRSGVSRLRQPPRSTDLPGSPIGS